MEKPFKGKCSTLFHWDHKIKIRVDLSFDIYKTKPWKGRNALLLQSKTKEQKP